MSITIPFGPRRVGAGEPVLIVAELSANHRQSYDTAVELVAAAHAAGADAVKLQTYTADTLTLDSGLPWFRIGPGTAWSGRTLHDLYQEAYTPWEWQPRLLQEATRRGLLLFSSPFDDTAVDFLEGMGVPGYKIASFELVDSGLLRRVAATGKPVILSTGMAVLEEIDEAVETLRGAGCRDLALLKCTSAYPAPAEEMNLATIPHLAARFGVPVGLSDHTLGEAVPVAAVALGASIVEKHLTLSRADGGPDAHFSLEPAEFARMVEAVRTTERAVGAVSYQATTREQASRVFRRSLFVVRDLRRGERFTHENVRSLRPAGGLPPRDLDRLLGRRAARDLPRGTPLSWDDVADG
jgi:N-acetylneuraminate synthase